MKQLGNTKDLMFKYKETRKLQGGSMCVADVEEFVLLKLYKSWRFKFRYISWVRKLKLLRRCWTIRGN